MKNNNCSPRMLWVKIQRLIRTPGRRKFLIGGWLIFVLAVTILIYKYQAYQQYHLKISNLRKKIIHLCNPPTLVVGREDEEPMAYAQFKLKQVQVVVRHGDRSSVSAELPSVVAPHHFSCNLHPRNSIHLEKIKQLKEMEGVFKKKRLSEGRIIADDLTLHEATPCKTGQLTSKGYLQHIYLGEYIYSAYGRKLGISLATVEEKQVLVFSTPYERTQQSAAGFLSGLFYPVFKNVKPPDNFPVINIQISPDKMGFFHEDENGEILPCPKLYEIAEKTKQTESFKRGMQTIEPLMQKVSYLFNITREKLPKRSWLGDLVLTHSCHKHPTMCGPNGCINDNMKAEILTGTDWDFTVKLSPSASIIAHPTLSKVFQRMVLTAGGEEHSKLVLFFTHDATLIPILVEFGIFPKELIPYTSRIVFELWEAAGLLATKLEGSSELEKHFVRVLYNGRDYTRKISPCKNSLKFGKLCSLKTFVTYLEGGSQSMGEQFSRLCKSKEYSKELESF